VTVGVPTEGKKWEKFEARVTAPAQSLDHVGLACRSGNRRRGTQQARPSKGAPAWPWGTRAAAAAAVVGRVAKSCQQPPKHRPSDVLGLQKGHASPAIPGISVKDSSWSESRL